MTIPSEVTVPWREISKVELRKDFAEAVLVDGVPMADACRLHGISRPTGYKWLRRYEAQGMHGLQDRSRAPKNIANRTPEDVEAAVVQLRQRYPSFGPYSSEPFWSSGPRARIGPQPPRLVKSWTDGGWSKPGRGAAERLPYRSRPPGAEWAS